MLVSQSPVVNAYSNKGLTLAEILEILRSPEGSIAKTQLITAALAPTAIKQWLSNLLNTFYDWLHKQQVISNEQLAEFHQSFAYAKSNPETLRPNMYIPSAWFLAWLAAKPNLSLEKERAKALLTYDRDMHGIRSDLTSAIATALNPNNPDQAVSVFADPFPADHPCHNAAMVRPSGLADYILRQFSPSDDEIAAWQHAHSEVDADLLENKLRFDQRTLNNFPQFVMASYLKAVTENLSLTPEHASQLRLHDSVVDLIDRTISYTVKRVFAAEQNLKDSLLPLPKQQQPESAYAPRSQPKPEPKGRSRLMPEGPEEGTPEYYNAQQARNKSEQVHEEGSLEYMREQANLHL